MNKEVVKHIDFTTTTEEDVHIGLVEDMLRYIISNVDDDYATFESRQDADETFSTQDIEHMIDLLGALRISGLRY